MIRAWQWLTQTNNPYDIYGFFPAHIWTLLMIVVGVMFLMTEAMGVFRYHQMIPLTWYWRCAPRWIWFTIAAVGIWHFAVVVTKVK
jgi:hypothetical protein